MRRKLPKVGDYLLVIKPLIGLESYVTADKLPVIVEVSYASYHGICIKPCNLTKAGVHIDTRWIYDFNDRFQPLKPKSLNLDQSRSLNVSHRSKSIQQTLW